MLRVLGWVTTGTFLLASANAAAQTSGQAGFPADEPAAPAPSAETAQTAPAAPTTTQTAPPAAATAPASHIEPAPHEVETTEPGKERTRHVSLTFSPLHLLSPIVEVQMEAMLTPHFGAALIGGIGSIKADATNADVSDQRFSAYELGVQMVGYPLRDFSSLQLGGEVLWIHIGTESYQGTSIKAAAGGVALGPFVGYKLITNAGFTFFAQGGFEYVAARAQVSDDQGNMARAEQKAFIPLLNLNIGWSF